MKEIKTFCTYYLIDGIADGEYGEDAYTEESSMTVQADFSDLLEGQSSCHVAAELLRSEGCTESDGNGSFYLPDRAYVVDYGTGQECEQSMHLHGFTADECGLVMDIIEADDYALEKRLAFRTTKGYA